MLKRLIMGLLLVASTMTFAGTTGTLAGYVQDGNGAALPGVVVTVSSSNLIGTKSAVSDSDGQFRIPLLPPGNYEMTATLEGFKTQKATFQVNLDQTTRMDVGMEIGGVEEVLTVTAGEVLLDTTSTTIGQNYDEEYFSELPTGRSTNSLVNLAPGVSGQDGSGGFVVYGSSGPESNYIIDGQNTTNMEYGLNGKRLNFDFVQEVQVKTGGYEAEFGRSTGAVINVLTKSGGNEFSGTVFGYFRDADFYADADEPEAGVAFNGSDEEDYGFTLGGYFIKDKLWFFAAANPAERTDFYNYHRDNPFRQGEFTDVVEDLSWSFKLTYNINENNDLVFNVLADPRDFTNRSSGGAPDTDQLIESGGTNYQLKYTSLLTDSLILEAQYGIHNETSNNKILNTPSFGTERGYLVYSLDISPSTIQRGGLGFWEEEDANRESWKVSLEGFFGSHQAKIGLDYEDNEFDSLRGYGDGYRFRLRGANANGEHSYAQIRAFVDRNTDGQTPRPGGARAITHTINTALFLQDTWEVNSRLNVKAGLRYEIQRVENATGDAAFELDENYAPRLGVTYDVIGNGKSKLYASYGRFYENVPLDINNRAFGAETFNITQIYLDENGVGLDPSQRTVEGFNPEWLINPDGSLLRGVDDANVRFEGLFGGENEPVSDNLKGQGLDEIIAGFEYEFMPNWSAGIKYIDKSVFRVIEDVSFDGGNTYIIANPGESIEFTWRANYELEFTDALGGEHLYNTGDHVTLTAEQTGFKDPKRDYKGIELSLRKSFSDNYAFNFYYLNSELKGDYIGLYLPFYGQTDPNITATYDLTSTIVNGDGFLPNDREHQAKLDGFYRFDWGLSVGTVARYWSGTPYSAYGTPPDEGYGEYHLIQRGTAGRLPSQTQFDMKLSYEWRFANRYAMNFYFDMFNIFDKQAATFVDEQITLDVLEISEVVNSDGSATFGSVDELSNYITSTDRSVRSDYGKATNLMAPRYYRFGVKFSF
ncbi:MAG: TonB-dependent receptor [Acidobacteria bacterium]|nr:TonB-dependent receptor [Acidobacteriota bacterium]